MLKKMRSLAKTQTSKGFVLGLVASLGLAMTVEAPPKNLIPTQTSATIFFAPPQEVVNTCSKHHDFKAVACARQTGSNRGIIIMPHACDPSFKQDDYALLLCHELSHLNGWKH